MSASITTATAVFSPFGAPDDSLGSDRAQRPYRRGEHWGHEVQPHARPNWTAIARAATPPGRRSASRARASPTRSPLRRHGPGSVRRRASLPPRPDFSPQRATIRRCVRPRAGSASAIAASAADHSCKSSRAAELGSDFGGNTGNSAAADRARLAGGADGRIGLDTTLAAHNFQRKNGIEPADGYAGTGLLGPAAPKS